MQIELIANSTNFYEFFKGFKYLCKKNMLQKNKCYKEKPNIFLRLYANAGISPFN